MKVIVLVLLAFVLITTTVSAEPGKNNDKESKNQGKNQEISENQGSSGNSGKNLKDSSGKNVDTASSSGKQSNKPENCDPNFPWKNHGEYVSCVAKLKLGGKTVSEAARSDIGKKNKNASSSALPSPESSSSATPSATPTPEATSSGGLAATITENLESLQQEINTVVSQFAALLDLLNPFN